MDLIDRLMRYCRGHYCKVAKNGHKIDIRQCFTSGAFNFALASIHVTHDIQHYARKSRDCALASELVKAFQE